MPMNLLKRTGLGLLLVLTAAAWLWWEMHTSDRNQTTGHAERGETSQPSANNAREATTTGQLREAPGPMSSKHGPDMAPPSESIVVTVNEIQTNPNAILLALSREEAVWLDRHGYPTEEELARVSFLSLQELEQRHDNGDHKATVLLAHKYIEEGDLNMAFAAFGDAAQKGSIYAREQAAIVNRDRNTDPALAHAFVGFALDMELARIFGDHRVDALIRRELPAGAVDVYVREGVLASLPAQLQLIAEDARMRGVPMPAPEPRPNADLWNQIDAGSVTEVTVYARPPGNLPDGP